MYGQYDGQGFNLLALIPFLLLMFPLAIGLSLVAGRVGRNKVLWAVLSLVPVVNYFFWIYAFFVVVLHMLDRLNGITAHLGVVIGPGGRA